MAYSGTNLRNNSLLAPLLRVSQKLLHLT